MAGEIENLPPRVFVASSKESLEIAKRIADLLCPEIAADVWDTLFEPGDNTLDNLLLFASLYEFGIFVLAADDLTDTKDGQKYEPRDNVILELGIFLGSVGRRRAFAVVVDGDAKGVKLPSDLLGNTYVPVNGPRLKAEESAKQEIDAVRKAILQRSKSAPLSLLPGVSLAVGYYQNFILPVGRLLKDVDSLPGTAGPIDLAKRGYEFTSIIPSVLSRAGIEHRDAYIRSSNLKSSVVPPPTPDRTRRGYDFFYEDPADDGPVQIYDYATPLRAAHEAIRLVLREGAMGERQKEYDILAQREIRSFTRTLEFLFNESDGAVFSNTVKFRYI